MAINGICPNPQAIEPRVGRPGTVSDIRCHVGDSTVSLLSFAFYKARNEVRSDLQTFSAIADLNK